MADQTPASTTSVINPKQRIAFPYEARSSEQLTIPVTLTSHEKKEYDELSEDSICTPAPRPIQSTTDSA
jgi:hypothetical protein